VIRITRCFFGGVGGQSGLSSEAVQGASLPLEGVHHVEGGDGLAAGVLGVGDGVADDVLQEHLEHPAGLLVDQAGDALDAAPAGQPPDGGLGDALDVVSEDLPVPLGASLACKWKVRVRHKVGVSFTAPLWGVPTLQSALLPHRLPAEQGFTLA